MKNKIQYVNFEASESENNYLEFMLLKTSESFPELTSYHVKIVKEKNIYNARVRGKYVKMDVTVKRSGPILLICTNKLIKAFEEKLRSASYRCGISQPIGMQRSSIFKYVENYNHY